MSETTRRELPNALAGGAPVLTSPDWQAACRRDRAVPDTILKLAALIGCGGRGTGAAKQALKADEGAV